MKKIFWDFRGEIPSKALLELVNDNVVEALKYYWTEGKPVAMVAAYKNTLFFEVFGPPKVTTRDPIGSCDCYTVKYNIEKHLRDFLNPYVDLGGRCSKSQREDICNRAKSIKKLCAELVRLADQELIICSDHEH